VVGKLRGDLVVQDSTRAISNIVTTVNVTLEDSRGIIMVWTLRPDIHCFKILKPVGPYFEQVHFNQPFPGQDTEKHAEGLIFDFVGIIATAMEKGDGGNIFNHLEGPWVLGAMVVPGCKAKPGSNHSLSLDTLHHNLLVPLEPA